MFTHVILKPLDRSKYDLMPELLELKSQLQSGKPADAKVRLKMVVPGTDFSDSGDAPYMFAACKVGRLVVG